MERSCGRAGREEYGHVRREEKRGVDEGEEVD